MQPSTVLRNAGPLFGAALQLASRLIRSRSPSERYVHCMARLATGPKNDDSSTAPANGNAASRSSGPRRGNRHPRRPEQRADFAPQPASCDEGEPVDPSATLEQHPLSDTAAV